LSFNSCPWFSLWVYAIERLAWAKMAVEMFTGVFMLYNDCHGWPTSSRRDMNATVWFIEGDIGKLCDKVKYSILGHLLQKGMGLFAPD
jgi:hypothetical protein